MQAAHSNYNIPPLRVLVVGGHPVVVAGLRSFLRNDPTLEVIGQAASAQKVGTHMRKLRPDVFVVVDHGVGKAAIEAARALREAHPEIAIVMMCFDAQCSTKEALRAGAHAVLAKDCGKHEVISVLNSLRSEDTGPRRVLRPRGFSGPASLSPREIQVLTMIAEGNTNKQVAEELGISVRTVETHRERLMRKLDVQGTAALTKVAITLGLIDPRD